MGTSCSCVLRVQVEDHACVSVARPVQKAFVVALDEPDRPVNHVDVMPPEILGGLSHEVGQSLARHIELADHLARRVFGAEVRVERDVIIVDIRAELVKIRPIELSVGRDVV